MPKPGQSCREYCGSARLNNTDPSVFGYRANEKKRYGVSWNLQAVKKKKVANFVSNMKRNE